MTPDEKIDFDRLVSVVATLAYSVDRLISISASITERLIAMEKES